jgi:hypothetical protein
MCPLPYRSEDWNVGLAKDLRDAAFAREFLLASIDEGVDIQVALGKAIRATGVKEFATQATLDRLLKPFGLRLSLAPIKGRSRPTAA